MIAGRGAGVHLAVEVAVQPARAAAARHASISATICASRGVGGRRRWPARRASAGTELVAAQVLRGGLFIADVTDARSCFGCVARPALSICTRWTEP